MTVKWKNEKVVFNLKRGFYFRAKIYLINKNEEKYYGFYRLGFKASIEMLEEELLNRKNE